MVLQWLNRIYRLKESKDEPKQAEEPVVLHPTVTESKNAHEHHWAQCHSLTAPFVHNRGHDEGSHHRAQHVNDLTRAHQNGVIADCIPLWRKWGTHLNVKTVTRGMGIPMLKIRRSRDRLIFNLGIHMLVRRYLCIETAPRKHECCKKACEQFNVQKCDQNHTIRVYDLVPGVERSSTLIILKIYDISINVIKDGEIDTFLTISANTIVIERMTSDRRRIYIDSTRNCRIDV